MAYTRPRFVSARKSRPTPTDLFGAGPGSTMEVFALPRPMGLLNNPLVVAKGRQPFRRHVLSSRNKKPSIPHGWEVAVCFRRTPLVPG